MSTPDDWDETDALIASTKEGFIAKLDAATDFDAVIADIKSRASE